MTDTSVFEQIFGGSFSQQTGITNPNIGYHCTKCKYELTRVNSGQAFDFQKMFYCTNKTCEHFGLVTVVAVKKKK